MEYISSLTIAIVGVLNPTYSTYRSLRKKTSQPRLEWLRYWAIFGIFYSITFVTDLILYWVPFYYLAKILFVFWLSSSRAAGAQIIFNYALVPILKDYENNLDRLVVHWRKKLGTSFWKYASRLSFQGSTVLLDVLKIFLTPPNASEAAGDELMDTSDETASSSSSSPPAGAESDEIVSS